MPYTSTHHLLSFGGTLPGEEQFTMGLRLLGLGSPSQEAEVTAVNAYADALKMWWGSSPVISAGAALAWVKLNQIGLDGKYTRNYTNRVDIATPLVGGGGPVRFPNQISLVASLLTNSSRGLAHKGRIFFPSPGLNSQIETDGRVPAALSLTNASSIASLLNTLNGVTAATVVVMSNVREGAVKTVRGVEVGRVLDTMRSRRSSLDEDHQGATTDPSLWAGGGGPF